MSHTHNVDELELEELVLKESVVSTMGLSGGQLQVGIKGDPSIRETAPGRARYQSEIDVIYANLEESLLKLLLERGIYRLFVGFNNAEIRTSSIFDPLREEIHRAHNLANPAYLDRQFPPIAYEDKVAAMREIYRVLKHSEHYQKYIPSYWKHIIEKRSQAWQPMSVAEIISVVKSLNIFRQTPTYYLRNASISIVQSLVRLQFNCDGTQILRSKDIQQFIDDNIPDRES